MKCFAFATVSLILAASSCAKVEVGTVVYPLETSYVIEATSLPVSENESPYFVDMTDVDKYVDFRILESLSKGKIIELKSVEPIRSESGEISMYVVKYNDGWDVISSDKRSPMVLASAESGEFEYSEAGPHRSYFNMVAEDIRSFVTYEDHQLVLTKSLSEESNENVKYWDAITASENFIQPYLVTPPDSLELIPLGHWELIGVESETEYYDEVDHLIPFEWGQGSPYNAYCPWSVQSPGTNVPAGCVAVAGAQTLAYLQDFFDLTINMPSTVTSGGYCDAFLVRYDDYNTSVWQDINAPFTLVADNAAAKIISYVGFLVQMEYGEQDSRASTGDLVDNLFKPNGIDCDYDDYDASVVKSELQSGLPVIVSANMGNHGGGHSFIIDGYRRYRKKYIYTYEWIYGPSTVPLPSQPPKIEIEYSSPYIEKIKINWGYSNSYCSNVPFYTPTENWTVTLNGVSYTYSHNKKMLYGFSII